MNQIEYLAVIIMFAFVMGLIINLYDKRNQSKRECKVCFNVKNINQFFGYDAHLYPYYSGKITWVCKSCADKIGKEKAKSVANKISNKLKK